MKGLSTYLQYLLPQRSLSALAGTIANSRTPWLKKCLIQRFMQHYSIDLSEALIDDPNHYASFNDFFTRRLKPGARPITANPKHISSPVDGYVAEVGKIAAKTLVQAKGHYYDLGKLLGQDESLIGKFSHGAFGTFYLAPHNYHRIHMPLTGELKQTIYLPGKLFSVNQAAMERIPALYSRNERLVCVFDTEAGPMAVILVGALFVGGMQTVWMEEPIRAAERKQHFFTNETPLLKGAELGQFKFGSTVIVLFAANKMTWSEHLTPQTVLRVGQSLGAII